MPYKVVKDGNQFCVEKKDGGKRIGCHDSREKAEKQIAAIYLSESRHMSALYILEAATGAVRTEVKDGKSYTVVPVVALVEGVIHAMNASAPELVRAATYEPTPPLWDGRPIFLGHPMKAGRPVSGSVPSVLMTSIGHVRNAGVVDGKLCMEAWLDERAPQELLDRIAGGDSIEVSVGVFVDTDKSQGEHNGKRYAGEWHNMVPDHLAILPAGDIGACSWAAGCGVRAASLRKGEKNEMTDKKNSVLNRVFNTLREVLRTNDTSDQEVRQDLYELLQAQGINADIVDVYDGYFVYCSYGPGEMSYYRRDYTKDATGAAVSLGDTATEVEPKRSYEPVAAASVTEPEPKAACSCQDKERINMERTERIKALIAKSKGLFVDADIKTLEGFSDERLTALEAQVGVEKVVEKEVVKEVVKEVPAQLSAEDQAALAEIKASAASRKASTIETLKASKRCDYTDEQLKAMSQGDLDKLVKLAGVATTSAVDFSGQGAPRAAADANAIPAPIDLGAALKAAAGK
jgi:uncharacterized protein DUF2213